MKPTLTKVSITQYDMTYTVESPYSDEDTLERLIRCVAACAFASSWSEEQVVDAFRAFVAEHDKENL